MFRRNRRFIKANAALIALIGFLFLLSYQHRTLFFRPGSVHQWRQADCLSITKNYYEEGMNFFQPTLHYQGVKDGKAVSECPLLNYTAALLWKVFGEHEFLYRLLEYAIFITAVFVLFNTLLKHTKSFWLSVLPVSLMLSSPLLVYYSMNFLADVPALSMAVICFCLLYNFSREGPERYFYLALVFGGIGVLMKASALLPLSLTFLVGVSCLMKNERFHLCHQGFTKKWRASVAMIVVAGLIASWYSYAVYYNNYNQNHIFLLTILPVWEMQQQQIIFNLKMLFNELFPLFLNKPMFFLFMAISLYVMGNLRKLDLFLRCAFVMSSLFFVLYLLIFFQVFTVHDYYLVNIFIFPVITFFCAALLFARTGFAARNRLFTRLFITCVIVFNSFHAAAIYRLRTIEDDKLAFWFPFISEDERNLAKYLFWSYGNEIKKVEDFTPVLRNHGISREDRVLSIPDQSYNVSLYFMDQKGFTLAREHIRNDSTVFDHFMDKVQYVVLCDTGLKETPSFRRAAKKFDHLFTQNAVQVFEVTH